jgi:Na+-translocating ferredoxin:NAD+ oxidoreductase RnfD subunit
MVPMAAGLALFGWRALAAIATVVASALIAWGAWRNVGARGRQMVPAQVLWSALLLGLMLPAHLASMRPLPAVEPIAGAPPWPLLVAGGFLVGLLHWLVGGAGTGRFHVALVSLLLIAGLFSSIIVPHWVLSRRLLFAGDLLQAPQPGSLAPRPEAWLERPPEPTYDAFWAVPASHWLTLYTRGDLTQPGSRTPMHELLRDRMPPLEDLVVGGHPTPIGQGSLIAVIVGGLFLLYRGVIDHRVPLGVLLTMYLALLILPTPTVISEQGVQYRWLIARGPDVRWETAITFVNYQVAAGPAAFVAFFVATAPSLRPLARRARVIYAVLIGLFAAAGQLYLSVALGPYLAVALVGLLSPTLDRWFATRTLV